MPYLAVAFLTLLLLRGDHLPAGGPGPANHFPPAHQYPSGPDVVIGGYVVRDPALPSFAGQCLFGRFDTGIIMRLGPQAGAAGGGHGAQRRRALPAR